MTNRSLSTMHLSRPPRFCNIGIVVLAVACLSAGCFAATAATMASPTPGTVLPNAPVTFKWSKGSGISDYKLSLGNSAGSGNIYSADEKTNTSVTVRSIPADGKTLYVKLSSKNSASGRWQSHTYTYSDASAVSKVSVSITPQTLSLASGATQGLTANVTGTTNTNVTWSTTGGTISGSGSSISYKAPTTAGTYKISATSVADPTKSATATATVTSAAQVSVSISPASVSLAVGTSQTFTSSVKGTTNTAVTWSATGGTITASGTAATYTAPSTPGTFNVTATSAADSSKIASGVVTVNAQTAQLSCTPMSLGQGASLNGVVPFPASNTWNQDVSAAAVDPNSATIVSYIGTTVGLHPDFGAGTYDGSTMGIPYVTVDSSQSNVNVAVTGVPSESDLSPVPLPSNAPIEGYPNPGDNHVIVLDKTNCFEYDLYQGAYSNGSWSANSTAIWDLQNGELRPYTWTSADAAGLPIFPGLVRYDEVASGAINHAIRFTVPKTEAAFVAPALHWAGTNSSSPIPMGMRMRLKASFDVSSYSASNQVILNAMKKYGLLLADNGSAIYISGTPDSRWNNDDLHLLGQVTASNFEVVKMGTVYTSANIPQGAAPSISSLSASSSTVSEGSPVVLTWNVAGASYLFITPVVGPVRGNTVTFSPTQTATYTLTATNQYGRSTATVTVNMQ